MIIPKRENPLFPCLRKAGRKKRNDSGFMDFCMSLKNPFPLLFVNKYRFDVFIMYDICLNNWKYVAYGISLPRTLPEKNRVVFPFKTNVQAFCLECLGVLSEMFRRSL